MKTALLCFLLAAGSLGLSGCYGLGYSKVAPAKYGEWSDAATALELWLKEDGSYIWFHYLPAQQADEEKLKLYDDIAVLPLGTIPGTKERERGSWKIAQGAIILIAKDGQPRTLTVHHDLRGQFLQDESGTYPRVYWYSDDFEEYLR